MSKAGHQKCRAARTAKDSPKSQTLKKKKRPALAGRSAKSGKGGLIVGGAKKRPKLNKGEEAFDERGDHLKTCVFDWSRLKSLGFKL